VQSDRYVLDPHAGRYLTVTYNRLGTTSRGWPFYKVTLTTGDGGPRDLGTVTNIGGLWESSATIKIYRSGTTDTRHEATRELLREAGLL
jgi:hypothetical protein